jgi:hypothetical protein
MRQSNSRIHPTRRALTPTAAAVAAAVFLGAISSANASTIDLNGVMGSDVYETSTSVLWYNDHQGTQFGSGVSALQTTQVSYGTHTLAGGDSTDYFFLFVEAPLAAKNLVWGTGASNAELDLYNQQYTTHHSPLNNNNPASSDYFDFEKAVGSEKFVFNGITANPKVEKPTNAFLGDDVTGPNLISAVSSISYVISQGICDTDGCAETGRTMSFEFQFDASARAGWIAWLNNSSSEINTHLSPERGGSLTPPPPPPSPVPAPGSLPLVAGFLGWLAFVRRRNAK